MIETVLILTFKKILMMIFIIIKVMIWYDNDRNTKSNNTSSLSPLLSLLFIVNYDSYSPVLNHAHIPLSSPFSLPCPSLHSPPFPQPNFSLAVHVLMYVLCICLAYRTSDFGSNGNGGLIYLLLSRP